jgi:hypothetical protein
MSPPPAADLAAARQAADSLLNLLHQVQGTVHLVASIPLITEPERWRPRKQARLLCDLFLAHVHLEGMLDGWKAAIDRVRSRLQDVRPLTLEVGRSHHRCAAGGLLAVAVSLRSELRGRFEPLATGLVPAARVAGDVDELARAADLAFRLGRGTGQLDESLSQDLGPRGLEVFEGLRRSADFQAAAFHAVSGTLINGVAALLDIDLGRLRQEVALEFDQAGRAPAVPADESGNYLRRVAGVWHFGYEDEVGEYPARGNQCIGWLAKLFPAPNRPFSVADLRGDPDGKLTADAQLGEARATEIEALRSIHFELRQVEDIAEEVGWSKDLEAKKTDLLGRVKKFEANKKISGPLRKAHHNVAAQIREFLKANLAKDMPKLAAHLAASLQLNYPDVTYQPPAGTPAWKT